MKFLWEFSFSWTQSRLGSGDTVSMSSISYTQEVQSIIAPTQTSLMVQRLRLHAATAGQMGQSLVGELGSHMPQGTAKRQKRKEKKKLLLLRIRHPCLFPDLCELDTWVWDRLSPRILYRHAAHTHTDRWCGALCHIWETHLPGALGSPPPH